MPFQKGNKINVGRIPWNKGKKGLQTSWLKGTKGIAKANAGSFTSEALKEKWADPEYKKRVSENISRVRKGNPLSTEHKNNLKGERPNVRGENNPNWKGGKKEDRCQGQLIEYRLWRADVFERDNFTCVLCDNRGGKLNAHHTKKWTDYPELRYEVSNGATLCVPCHDKTKKHEEEYETELSNKLGEAT